MGLGSINECPDQIQPSEAQQLYIELLHQAGENGVNLMDIFRNYSISQSELEELLTSGTVYKDGDRMYLAEELRS